MATFTDCTPSAIDITQALSNKPIPNLSAALAAEPKSFTPIGEVSSDVAAGTAFHENAPDLLFVAEYVYSNKVLGVLVVWEDYYAATHYEVHRRNLLSATPDWERIIFLGRGTLNIETTRFLPYIEQVLGLKANKLPMYAVLDTSVQQDKIYEYKIVAGYYPKSAKMDYALLLRSKALMNYIPIKDATVTLRQFASSALGSEDYAWIIALLNLDVSYLGSSYDNATLWDKVGTRKEMMVPKDPADLVRVIAESIHVFGAQETIKNLLASLHDSYAANVFNPLVVQSIDDKTQTLSWDKLNTLMLNAYPNYKILTEKTAARATTTSSLSNIHVIQYTGKATFDSIGQITLMMLRLNSLLLVVQNINSKTGDAQIRALQTNSGGYSK